MKDDHELIVIAAYDDLDAAKSDFEDVERGRKHSLELRAAALVTKNADGQPEVLEAANKPVPASSSRWSTRTAGLRWRTP
jgi:uncharacterized membrane protein